MATFGNSLPYTFLIPDALLNRLNSTSLPFPLSPLATTTTLFPCSRHLLGTTPGSGSGDDGGGDGGDEGILIQPQGRIEAARPSTTLENTEPRTPRVPPLRHSTSWDQMPRHPSSRSLPVFQGPNMTSSVLFMAVGCDLVHSRQVQRLPSPSPFPP